MDIELESKQTFQKGDEIYPDSHYISPCLLLTPFSTHITTQWISEASSSLISGPACDSSQSIPYTTDQVIFLRHISLSEYRPVVSPIETRAARPGLTCWSVPMSSRSSPSCLLSWASSPRRSWDKEQLDLDSFPTTKLAISYGKSWSISVEWSFQESQSNAENRLLWPGTFTSCSIYNSDILQRHYSGWAETQINVASLSMPGFYPECHDIFHRNSSFMQFSKHD